MKVQKTVVVGKPLDAVFGYLTEVTYAAEFTFKGPARYIAPLLRPALDGLGQHAQAGLYQALNKL